jgi:hypothetical protein
MTGWEMISCQRGHDTHDTREIVVSIGGPTKYRDLPAIPRRFTDTFEMEIWDTAQYPVDDGPWCPAHDAVSETLVSHGVWEPAETTLMLEAFRYCDTFIDIGAQLGWYSILAARAGLNVYALEADLDVAEVCNRNIARHAQTSSHFGVHVARVGPTLPALGDAWPTDERIAVKIDIEGAEADAVAMLAGAMDMIDFMLIEISPVFNDTYPELVRSLMDSGFRAYVTPTKQMPPARLEIFPDDLREFEMEGDVEALIKTWHQENVLFVRDGAW